MLDPRGLPVFVAASIVLLLTPGPAVLYVVTRSASQGRVAGLVSVLGVELGNLAHVAAAALGLSALLLSSSVAFSVVKYVGAAYLVYLGLRRIFARSDPVVDTPPPQSLLRVFRQGAVVATLNPKTALFFVAFLPQFADPSRGPLAPQLLILGCLFVAMAVATDGMYALLAGKVGQWLRARSGAARVSRYVSGGVYIGLGVSAALGRRP